MLKCVYPVPPPQEGGGGRGGSAGAEGSAQQEAGEGGVQAHAVLPRHGGLHPGEGEAPPAPGRRRGERRVSDSSGEMKPLSPKIVFVFNNVCQ